jgi:hypothetical protein
MTVSLLDVVSNVEIEFSIYLTLPCGHAARLLNV